MPTYDPKNVKLTFGDLELSDFTEDKPIYVGDFPVAPPTEHVPAQEYTFEKPWQEVLTGLPLPQTFEQPGEPGSLRAKPALKSLWPTWPKDQAGEKLQRSFEREYPTPLPEDQKAVSVVDAIRPLVRESLILSDTVRAVTSLITEGSSRWKDLAIVRDDLEKDLAECNEKIKNTLFAGTPLASIAEHVKIFGPIDTVTFTGEISDVKVTP